MSPSGFADERDASFSPHLNPRVSTGSGRGPAEAASQGLLVGKLLRGKSRRVSALDPPALQSCLLRPLFKLGGAVELLG